MTIYIETEKSSYNITPGYYDEEDEVVFGTTPSFEEEQRWFLIRIMDSGQRVVLDDEESEHEAFIRLLVRDEMIE